MRGIAILLVLIHHGTAIGAGPPTSDFDDYWRRVTGVGWAGVDLFFVLSGFLITGILLDARGRAHAWVNFYGRRALRILPVYVVLLAALLLVLPLLVPHIRSDGDWLILRDNVWSYVTFTMNIQVAFNPQESLGRFGNGHLWSLMVEEQFYLVWPLAMLVLPRRALLPMIALCIVGAPALRFVMTSGVLPRLDNGLSAMILMPARVDSLAWGGLVALCLREPAYWRRLASARWPLGIASAIVLLFLVLAQGDLDALSQSTQRYALAPLAIIFMIAIAGAVSSGPSTYTRVLSHPLLGFFGKYSYALYVFHFQIMVEVARQWDDGRLFGSILVSRLVFTVITVWFSVVAAWLSWNLVEDRMLALKRMLPGSSVAPQTKPSQETEVVAN